jgi:hypothetical protein
VRSTPGKKSEAEFTQQLTYGMRLEKTEELVTVSPLKGTALGTGHFVTTRATIRDQHGDLVATLTNTLFRYSPELPEDK